VRVLNDSPTPVAYRFLDPTGLVETWDEALAETRFAEADALVVLDTSNRQRIGRVGQPIDRHAIAIAIVDHHVTHDGFGQVNLVEPQLASTASLVWDLVGEAGWTPDAVAAEALYVGLFTDTGNFRYSNSDAHAHRMAASLIELGVAPEVTVARVHSTAPAGRLRFFGEVLATLEVLEAGRLVVLEATPEQFARHGLVGADTEGLVDMPRAIAGVEVVALFSEVEPGKVKVSLRSAGRVAIDQVCARLGGGGHPHAAGVQMRGSRADARARILPELAKVLAGLDERSPGGVPA
jgi:phosphoesterase RecJ-like protein